MFLKDISEELRQEMREKSRASFEAKRELGKELQALPGDENYWRTLASSYNIRLPATYISNAETKYLKRVAKKLGFDYKLYLDSCGASSLNELVSFNPDWPAFAEVGLMLEWYEGFNEDR